MVKELYFFGRELQEHTMLRLRGWRIVHICPDPPSVEMTAVDVTGNAEVSYAFWFSCDQNAEETAVLLGLYRMVAAYPFCGQRTFVGTSFGPMVEELKKQCAGSRIFLTQKMLVTELVRTIG